MSDVCDGTTACVVRTFARRPLVVKAGFFGLGLGAGAAIGVLVTKQVLETRFDKILEKELEDARLYYKVLYKKEQYSDVAYLNEGVELAVEEPDKLDELVDERLERQKSHEHREQEQQNEEVIEEEGYAPPDDDYEPPETHTPIPQEKLEEASWIFNEHDNQPPRQEQPYLISEEELRENLVNHRQAEWTYYEEDGAVVDETESQIFHPEEVLGDIDLQRFDELADNGVMIYVRNEKLELDVVLTIDYGSWEKSQLGYEEENTLEHEYRRDSRKVRKFRSDHG